MNLSISFKNFPLMTDERLNLTEVSTKGNSLEELLEDENMELYFEDWHGNTCCEGWTLGDLHDLEIEYIQNQIIAKYLPKGIKNEKI